MNLNLSLPSAVSFVYIDKLLLVLLALLVSTGLILIASASISYASEMTGDGFYFVRRQSVFVLIGLLVSAVLLMVPSHLWRDYGWLLVFAALGMLLLVLIPGIGHEVNGSRRWLKLGPIALQASEVAKFSVLVFMAGYIERNQASLQQESNTLIKALLPVGILVFLLLMEPDLGGSVVLLVTVASMLFVAGARLRHFLSLAVLGIGFLVLAIVMSPYRMRRLVAYLDPWADQFDGGYQLTQSLIAVGRGEWFGVGLGNSVQKLLYLPEAHTDFVFAIFAEEFGFVGALALISLFSLIIYRLFKVSQEFLQRRQTFAGYLVFGVAILISLQVFINIGVTTGLLPTKGLTLPFISYGGSSLVIMMSTIALVVRVQWELGASKLKVKKSEVRYG